jgi:hypothetical protein
MSDSFSENWPLWSAPWELPFYDLGAAPRKMYRAVWSQLIYNRETKQSLFLAALSAAHEPRSGAGSRSESE